MHKPGDAPADPPGPPKPPDAAGAAEGSGYDGRFPARECFAAGAQFVAGRLVRGTSGRTHTVVDPST
ncbi:MAG TPA: hypothetical protein VFP69_16015, partial [Streptomyces sp.]|nr:hypothetical protein [Streptomyces sp.]